MSKLRNFISYIPFILFMACVVFLTTIYLGKYLNQGYQQGILPPIQTSSFDYDTLLDEAPVVLNIFATWCGPCRQEHKHLVSLKEKGIPIYGLVFKDTQENVENYLQKTGNPYKEIGYANNSDIFIQLGLKGVPETFVIGKGGTILFHHYGPVHDRLIEQKILPHF